MEKKLKLIGLRRPHKTTNENGRSSIDCGSHWQTFEKEAVSERIPDKFDDTIYAVYFDYEADHTRPYSYFIGCRVPPESTAPEGLDVLEIPAQSYQKFTAVGNMPDCVSDIWKKIWAEDKDRVYGFDFEVYDQRSKDWNNAEVDVFVSVK